MIGEDLGLYDLIAARLPLVRELVCDECGHADPISRKVAAVYCKNGWPKHCGITMRLVTEKEAREHEHRSDREANRDA